MKSFRRLTVISPEFTFKDLVKEGGVKVKYPKKPHHVRATMFYYTENGWQNFDKDLRNYTQTLGYEYEMNLFRKDYLQITATSIQNPPNFRMLAIVDVWF